MIIILFVLILSVTSFKLQCQFSRHSYSMKLYNTNSKLINDGKTSKPPKFQKWRVFNIEVLHDQDPGKNSVLPHDNLLKALNDCLKDKNKVLNLQVDDITIVKKAFDGRWKKSGQPKWVYTVDLNIPSNIVSKIGLREIQGKFEKLIISSNDQNKINENNKTLLIEKTDDTANNNDINDIPISTAKANMKILHTKQKPKIIIVGAGPSGLFAAVTLVHAGYSPIILERGYPVEQRGKDIGALFNRKILNSESNLCYGEGGAGTWSDGKLTTRIGKNSDDVRNVLKTLVHHGAPERILIDNKPHLGTDRLVRILKDLRQWLIENGSEFRFGCKVNDIIMNNGASNVKGIQQIKGVKLETGEILDADFIVLAVGHSARGLYQTLNHHNILLLPKPIAVGFRIEHPQELINKIQYGEIFSQQTLRGKGSIPVADYRLATQIPSTISTTTSTTTNHNNNDHNTINDNNDSELKMNMKKSIDNSDTSSSSSSNSSSNNKVNKIRDLKAKKSNKIGSNKETNDNISNNSNNNNNQDKNKQEKVVVERGGGGDRGCYSFCMCPGGQIVPTSVDPHELCVNGMSFSQRQSPYANAALVVTVNPSDLGYKESSDTSSSSEKVDPLIGVYWQQEIERKAAIMGGGNLVSPVQRVTDFLSEVPTPANGGLNYHSEYYGDTNLRIPSSYRMGVVGAACHEIYPDYVTKSLQQALLNFDRELRGFITPDAILHGVETRTSSPIQIVRDSETYECLSVNGLYPTGEGAGYAGGIVSAAVDGVKVGNAIIDTILGRRVSSNINNNDNIEENPIKKSSSIKKLYIPTSY